VKKQKKGNDLSNVQGLSHESLKVNHAIRKNFGKRGRGWGSNDVESLRPGSASEAMGFRNDARGPVVGEPKKKSQLYKQNGHRRSTIGGSGERRAQKGESAENKGKNQFKGRLK